MPQTWDETGKPITAPPTQSWDASGNPVSAAPDPLTQQTTAAASAAGVSKPGTAPIPRPLMSSGMGPMLGTPLMPLGVGLVSAPRFAASLAGSLAGGKGGNLIADKIKASSVVRSVLTAGGALLGGGLTSLGTGAISDALPSTERAGQAFSRASSAAGDVPVDVSEAGTAALKAKDLADAGATMPKVLNRFVVRATDPNGDPITYDEARLFYQNAGRLSADESSRMAPAMRMHLNNFRVGLGNALGRAADTVGAGEDYRSGMSEYASASRLKDLGETAKDIGLKLAPLGAAGYALRRLLQK